VRPGIPDCFLPETSRGWMLDLARCTTLVPFGQMYPWLSSSTTRIISLWSLLMVQLTHSFRPLSTTGKLENVWYTSTMQQHTRGTDINFPRGTRAAVVLGQTVTDDRLIRGEPMDHVKRKTKLIRTPVMCGCNSLRGSHPGAGRPSVGHSQRHW
jgi:hypothetical protein